MNNNLIRIKIKLRNENKKHHLINKQYVINNNLKRIVNDICENRLSHNNKYLINKDKKIHKNQLHFIKQYPQRIDNNNNHRNRINNDDNDNENDNENKNDFEEINIWYHNIRGDYNNKIAENDKYLNLLNRKCRFTCIRRIKLSKNSNIKIKSIHKYKPDINIH